MTNTLHIVECPRDAMQGLHDFIPTKLKARYLNALLKVGYHTLDFGSFVSPKAIPQLKDTAQVLELLDLPQGHTPLLAIVANMRGAEAAAAFEQISYLGFPLSLSETFQQRNTNIGIEKAFEVVQNMQALCQKSGKTLVTYISMGFGNPYGDPYSMESIEEFVQKLDSFGVKIISLADTVGAATPQEVTQALGHLIPTFEHITFGAHLHCTPQTALPKVQAVWQAGCRRIDAAMMGLGGCPMATDDLTGNLATESVIDFCSKNYIEHGLNMDMFKQAGALATQVFPL